MAKKSFKKGVDSLIQPTGNQKENAKMKNSAKENSPKEEKPKKQDPIKGNQIVELGSKLTIDKVEELKKAILEASKKSNNVTLKSSKVEDIDLAFIQMIKAVERSFKAEKKSLKIDIKISESVKELLVHSGFGDVFN